MRCFEEHTVLRSIRRELLPDAMQAADAHMALRGAAGRRGRDGDIRL